MNTILLAAEIVRFVLGAIVILFTRIPFTYKILLAWALDRLDCMPDMWPKRGPLFTRDTSICRTETYSMYDKVGDVLLNTLLLYESSKYYPQYTPLLTFLYMVRLVGILRYFKTRTKREFVYFPNFFITTVLVLSVFKHLTPILGLGILAYQYPQEIYMHWYT